MIMNENPFSYKSSFISVKNNQYEDKKKEKKEIKS